MSWYGTHPEITKKTATEYCKERNLRYCRSCLYWFRTFLNKNLLFLYDQILPGCSRCLPGKRSFPKIKYLPIESGDRYLRKQYAKTICKGSIGDKSVEDLRRGV